MNLEGITPDLSYLHCAMDVSRRWAGKTVAPLFPGPGIYANAIRIATLVFSALILYAAWSLSKRKPIEAQPSPPPPISETPTAPLSLDSQFLEEFKSLSTRFNLLPAPSSDTRTQLEQDAAQLLRDISQFKTTYARFGREDDYKQSFRDLGRAQASIRYSIGLSNGIIPVEDKGDCLFISLFEAWRDLLQQNPGVPRTRIENPLQLRLFLVDEMEKMLKTNPDKIKDKIDEGIEATITAKERLHIPEQEIIIDRLKGPDRYQAHFALMRTPLEFGTIAEIYIFSLIYNVSIQVLVDLGENRYSADFWPIFNEEGNGRLTLIHINGDHFVWRNPRLAP